MYITACYIVKNEEKNLEKSLSTITGNVDEIVVVDTGSVDGTIAIAQKYGAKVYKEPWLDDFSKARNASIEKATGDWIIIIDADEYFTEDTAGNIRQVIAENLDCDVICISMDNIDKQNGNNLLVFNVPRIIRNTPEIRYHGAIHEELRYNDAPLEKVGIVPATKLKMIHTGYSQSLSLFKAERNLKLLLKEYESVTDPGYLYAYMAECYSGLGMVEKAKYYAKLDIAQGRRKNNYASKSWHILLKYAALDNDYIERKRIALDAVEKFPEVPDFHAELAECYAFESKYKDAITEAVHSELLYRNYRGIEPIRFTEDSLNMLKVRKNIWSLKLEKGERYVNKILNIQYNLKNDIKKDVCNLCAIIVRLSNNTLFKDNTTVLKKLTKLLPDRIRFVFDAWMDNKTIESENFDEYFIVLSYVIKYGTKEQLMSYVIMCEAFSADKLLQVAERLFEDECWGEAYSLYHKIAEETSNANQNLWLHAGICQYENNNFPEAKICFMKAQSIPNKNVILDAYIVWNERQMDINGENISLRNS